jgi:chromosome segregation ATPase
LKELRNSEKKKEIEKRLIEEREKMKDHKEQLQGTFQQVDSWPERYEKSSLRVKNLEEHLREAHQKIYGQNLELQGKEKELEDLHAILTSLKEDLEDAKNSLNCSKKENIALEAQSKKAEEYIEKLRIELKSTKEEYEYIKKELEATLQRLAGTESDYETSKKLLKRKINNLKKALSKQLKLNDDKLKENKLVPCRDNVPSVNNINNTESKRENDIKFCYIKNVLLKFVTSTCNEQRALISIISQLLKLNESEKEMLVKSLEKQSNTFW